MSLYWENIFPEHSSKAIVSPANRDLLFIYFSGTDSKGNEPVFMVRDLPGFAGRNVLTIFIRHEK